MKNIVILISGNGSNLQAIIDACQKKTLSAQISAVFSDNPNAYGLSRAKRAAIPTVVLPKKKYSDRNQYDEVLMEKIEQYQPNLIVLAGYMRILTPQFVNHYLGKIINIHPSLLPKYPGLNSHHKVLSNGDKEHGASIHFVTEQLDSGPIILQAKIPIFIGDNIQDIVSRVQNEEHRIYPLVIDWFLKGRLTMMNSAAFLDGCKIL